MTDAELMAWFERASPEPGRFAHREHVRLTWLYLIRYGRPETERRLLAGLQALATRAGAPERFDAALTLAWIDRIDRARMAMTTATFEELLRQDSALADPVTVRAGPQGL
jgi:hypothetical protein